MSCKSAIYTVNETQVTALQSNSTLPLGTIIRRFGSNLNLSGNGILIEGQGYYQIDATITFTPTSAAAENYTVQLFKDGVQIPGAKAVIFIGTTTTVSINALVRQQCCSASSNITFAITATTPTNTVTLNNVSVVMEKL